VRRPRLERGRPKARGSQPTRVCRIPPSAHIGRPGGTRTHTDGAFEALASADCATGLKGAPTVGLEPTRADLGNPPPLHRRGYGAPSWSRTNVVGLEGRLPVHRPGRIGAGAGSRTRLRRRWQRYLAPCAPAFGSCRRICTCCLRLIRSVLICMSFAAVYWSERLDSNQRSRAPEARALVQAEPHSGSGQEGRTCTCGFRVPSSAVCC
jgi:hypothetical protein